MSICGWIAAIDGEYRRNPSNRQTRRGFAERDIAWPALPGSDQSLTRDLRDSMVASETGHSPTEFWSSFESKSGCVDVSEWLSVGDLTPWLER